MAISLRQVGLIASALLDADHCVSDGHRGALFLRELAELLQHPEELDKETS